jgi:hypothetical protein
MPPIPLPFTDALLRLSPPLPGYGPAVRAVLTLLLLAAALAAIGYLYRREMRLVPRRFALALLGLRLALVAALLLTVALDPSVARTVREEVPGRVLIAVDRSDSMTVTDPSRPLAEKLRLAKALQLVPDLAGDGQLDAWVRQAEATGTPAFDQFGGQGERERFEKVVERIDGTTRLQLVTRALTPDGLKLIDGLREKHAVEVVGFGQDVSALPADLAKLAAALSPPPGGPRTLYTDLKPPLARAGESAADADDAVGPKLLGVILVTDGRHNWGESPAVRARDLGQRGIPVYPVAVAPKDPPADVAVVTAQAQASTVFKGSVVPVEVGVRVTGWPAGKITVRMDYPEANGAARKPLTEVIEHDGKDAVYPVAFKARMDVPGPQLLKVTAEPEQKDRDRFPENNVRAARVNVVKDRAKVMLIDGEARWEFHYLHTCLGRDPNMDVRSVVFRQPRLNKVSEEELRKTGTPARKLPDDLDVLTSYDCVVLGDVEPEQLTPKQKEAIEKYVAESGGTLVMAAGKRAMPLGYTDDADPFRKLLPVRNPKSFHADDGFRFNVTPEGDRSWFLAMGDTGPQSRAAWERFPAHHWAVLGELKDGAEALAAAPGGPARERAVLARQSYGFGRVLFVGVDSTWRWRFRAGDYYHHRFWGQVAQWAASDRLLPVTNAAGTIRFGTREPIYAGGQDAEVVVRTSEAVKKLTPTALKGAKVIRLPAEAGGKETPVTLAPLGHPDGRPRDLAGKVRDLTPGRYAVELEVPEWADQLQGPPGPDGRAGRLRCTFEVAPPDNEELVDLAANLPLLDELAQASGGKVYTLENARELIDALAARSATREHFTEFPLRRSWGLYGLLVALLTLEWGVRKWAGLP